MLLFSREKNVSNENYHKNELPPIRDSIKTIIICFIILLAVGCLLYSLLSLSCGCIRNTRNERNKKQLINQNKVTRNSVKLYQRLIACFFEVHRRKNIGKNYGRARAKKRNFFHLITQFIHSIHVFFLFQFEWKTKINVL